MIISHAHIHVAADAVAEVIGAFGFEQEYHALQVETGSDGKPRFTHQPFLEVGDSLKPPVACTLLALWLSHAVLAFLTSLKLVSALSSALSVSMCVLRSAYLSQSLLSYGACLRVTCAVHLLRHGPDSLRLHIICGQHLILYVAECQSSVGLECSHLWQSLVQASICSHAMAGRSQASTQWHPGCSSGQLRASPCRACALRHEPLQGACCVCAVQSCHGNGGNRCRPCDRPAMNHVTACQTHVSICT